MTQDMNDLIAELSDLRLPELKERYREATGQETRCPNKTYLIRSICSALKEAPNDAGDPEEPSALADADVEALDDQDDASEPTIERNAERAPAEGATTMADVAPDGPADPGLAAPGKAPHEAHQRQPRRQKPERQARGRFSSMTVEELQVKYREVVGRDTGSDDKRYLIWKIREAEKGRIPVGPRPTRARSERDADVKILPLRLDAEAVAAMDEAWRKRGMKTRMEFLRRALGHYLGHLGALDAAARFTSEDRA